MQQQSRMEALGDRAKMFEKISTEDYLIPNLPVIMRLDGQAFHTVTRKLPRPICVNFRESMVNTMKFLVDKLHASFGYTQSDEITLGFHNCSHLFNGKKHKLLSTSAGKASGKFNQEIYTRLPELNHYVPSFDSRVWNVPSYADAVDAVLFRVEDCARCSVNMLASTIFTAEELHGKKDAERRKMLFDKGVPWEEMSDSYKFGVFAQRRTYIRELTPEERILIPPRHWPKEPILRSEIAIMDWGDIRKIPVPDLIPLLFPVPRKEEDESDM